MATRGPVETLAVEGGLSGHPDRLTATWHWVGVTIEIEGDGELQSVFLSSAEARRLGEWLIDASRPRDPDGAF